MTIVVSLIHSELFDAGDPAAWAWFAFFAASAAALAAMLAVMLRTRQFASSRGAAQSASAVAFCRGAQRAELRWRHKRTATETGC